MSPLSDPPRNPLFLSVADAAKMMGISPEPLARALRASQIPSIVIVTRRLVARATIGKLAALDKGVGVMELFKSKPSPAGELFSQWAAALKPMEASALLVG